MYAGFWRRLGAAIIDGIILLIASVIFSNILYVLEKGGYLSFMSSVGYFQLFNIIFSWLYYVLFEISTNKATPGKMILGIEVTDLNGNRISFGKATGRFFSKIISTIILLIGFFMAGFTRRKQSLHDIIAGCLVVTKKSLPLDMDIKG